MAYKEVTAVMGEYVNAQGETKKKYQKIGAIIESKHGPMLKLDHKAKLLLRVAAAQPQALHADAGAAAAWPARRHV